jgi:hypothetical protein
MSRVESNRRYYDKTRRKIHAANGHITHCNMRGPIGKEVTCKKCLDILRAKAVGTRINEWEAKRLKELARLADAERSRRWRAANPEKAREACRRWRERNKDLQRIAHREWAAKNVEHRRAYMREYLKNYRRAA